MPRRDSRYNKATTAPRTPPKSDTKNVPNSSPSHPVGPSNVNESPMKAPVSNAPGGSGLFAQMAATAGGVAVGSALGRVLGGFFEGSDTKDDKTVPAPPSVPSAPATTQPQKLTIADDCSWEIERFLKCVDKEVDMKVCEGFKEAMKQCRQSSSPSTESLYQV